MNYQDKTVGITGYTGFIGKEIAASLENEGAKVKFIEGDMRDPATFSVIDHTFDYLFHFADPSSEVLFKRQAMYAAEVTVAGFINAARACKQNGVKLIYPSTGLLSMANSPENKNLRELVGTVQAIDGNHYARCKKICEDIHLTEGLDALAIRIFATYGPGEAHKRDYASVPYLFARDFVAGRRPVIFGDGNQVRDFIYIDDVAQAILVLAEECNEPVIDLGSGEQTSFNDIIDQLRLLTRNDDLKVDYIDKPAGYVQETTALVKPLSKYYKPKISFNQGIMRTYEALRDEEAAK